MNLSHAWFLNYGLSGNRGLWCNYGPEYIQPSQGGAEGVSWGYCDYLCGAGVGDALGAAVVHATVVTLRSEDASSSALAIQVRVQLIGHL